MTGRVGWWLTDQATDSATVEEDAPEWVWNAQYRKVFGTSTFLEAKFTGYTGYYYLDPVDPRVRPPTTGRRASTAGERAACTTPTGAGTRP